MVTESCIVRKIDKSCMKWAGRMVRMKDERLWKISETKNQGCFGKQEKPKLRWEDCLRTLRKAQEEDNWR